MSDLKLYYCWPANHIRSEVLAFTWGEHYLVLHGGWSRCRAFRVFKDPVKIHRRLYIGSFRFAHTYLDRCDPQPKQGHLLAEIDYPKNAFGEPDGTFWYEIVRDPLHHIAVHML